MAGSATCATGGKKGSWLAHIKGTSPMTIKGGGKSPKATSMPGSGSKATSKGSY